MDLSPRLALVASYVPVNSRLADVGTDHAYLPTWLLLQGKIRTGIASDLRQGPLSRAKATAKRYGVEDRLSFRLCDGLDGIFPHEAETVVIAGIGGETMISILQEAPWTKACFLVLQPMTSLPELRQWLMENGYAILTERGVKDHGTIYVVLTVAGEEMTPLTPGEQYGGRPSCWGDDPLRGEYLRHLLGKARRELAGVEQSSKPADVPRRDDLRQTISELTAWEEEWTRDYGTGNL